MRLQINVPGPLGENVWTNHNSFNIYHWKWDYVLISLLPMEVYKCHANVLHIFQIENSMCINLSMFKTFNIIFARILLCFIILRFCLRVPSSVMLMLYVDVFSNNFYKAYWIKLCDISVLLSNIVWCKAFSVIAFKSENLLMGYQ